MAIAVPLTEINSTIPIFPYCSLSIWPHISNSAQRITRTWRMCIAQRIQIKSQEVIFREIKREYATAQKLYKAGNFGECKVVWLIGNKKPTIIIYAKLLRWKRNDFLNKKHHRFKVSWSQNREIASFMMIQWFYVLP